MKTIDCKSEALDSLHGKSHALFEILRKNIEKRKLTGKIPGERILAKQYHVNFKTANRAVRQLVDLGLAQRVRGRGTFITDKAPVNPADTMVALVIQHRGHIHEDIYNNLVNNLQQRGYFPILINQNEQESPIEMINRVLAINPIALIVDRGGEFFPYEYLKEQENRIRRLILLVSPEQDLEFNADYVLPDHWYGAYKTTRHLLENGHRRILLVNHVHRFSPEKYRFSDHYLYREGYRAALAEFNCLENEQYLWQGTDASENTIKLEEVLSSADRPTAVFAINDFRIADNWNVFKKLQLNIPNDLALIGYMNTPWCQRTEVPLSSVSIKEHEIARITVDLISKGKANREKVMIKPKLILRESSNKEQINT